MNSTQVIQSSNQSVERVSRDIHQYMTWSIVILTSILSYSFKISGATIRRSTETRIRISASSTSSLLDHRDRMQHIVPVYIQRRRV